MKTKGLWLAAIALGCLSGIAKTQTNISGPITANTTWSVENAPYIIVGNTLVQEGVTLTIEPGVTVKFESEKALQVDGALIAIGEVEMPVRFTSASGNPTPGDWGFLSFSNTSADAVFDPEGNWVGGSTLQYCRIEFASGGIYNQGAVIIENALPYIFRCVISDNNASGIYGYDLSGTLKVRENVISGNKAPTGGGIFVWGGHVLIEGNTIAGNVALSSYGGGGIFATSNSTEIYNNLIEENTSIGYGAGGGGGGIYIRDASSTITGNIIRHNVLNNSFSMGEGGGILSYGSVVNIIRNEITHNLGGNGGGIFGGNLIESNCISENKADERGGAIYMSQHSVLHNSLVYNTAQMGSAIDIYLAENPAEFSYNTLRGNVVTGEEPAYTMSFSAHPVARFNNILDNTATYELYNQNGSLTPHLDARYNWWETASETEIQEIIFDWIDNATLGIVDYLPCATAIQTDAPVSPPSGLNMNHSGGSIHLTWNANPEPDLAGYKVHWGTSGKYPYENTLDVGNVTSHSLTGLAGGPYFVSVTAYDSFADTVPDDPLTRVNETQCAGNESWYAKAVSTLGIEDHTASQGSKVQVFPNPSHGTFLLQVLDSATGVMIFNSFGQMIREAGIQGPAELKFEIDRPGTYLIRVITREGSICLKVVIL